MGTYKPLADDVAAITRLLTKAIQAALDEQEELARRALLKGGAHFNRAFLNSLRHDLRELAEERGIEIVNGKFSDRLERALRKAVDEVPGASYGSISRDLLDMALANSEVLVQDILDDGVKLINGEMAKILTGSQTVSGAADAIREKVTLADGGEIDANRAELIASSELGSVYRQGQLAAGEQMGFSYYEYMGPDDDRTTDICAHYMDQGAHTMDEWEQIVSERAASDKDASEWTEFQLYGGHYGCRGHALKPVPTPDDAGTQRNADADATA